MLHATAKLFCKLNDRCPETVHTQTECDEMNFLFQNQGGEEKNSWLIALQPASAHIHTCMHQHHGTFGTKQRANNIIKRKVT